MKLLCYRITYDACGGQIRRGKWTKGVAEEHGLRINNRIVHRTIVKDKTEVVLVNPNPGGADSAGAGIPGSHAGTGRIFLLDPRR